MKLPDDPDMGTMRDFAVEKFHLAEQFIEDAKEAHRRKSNNTAVNRAYYALFKIVTAVQTLDKKKFRSHRQALGDFNYEYIHLKGIFPGAYGEKMYDVMRLRHTSDYEEFDNPTDEETQAAITFAEEFYTAAKRYCDSRMESNENQG